MRLFFALLLLSTSGWGQFTTLPAAGGGADGVGYDEVAEEGSGLTKRPTLNFIGSGVTCVDNSGSARTDCTFTGGAAYATVEDEGTPLTQRSVLNFTGAGVTCTDDAVDGETDCAIPGGGAVTVNTGTATSLAYYSSTNVIDSLGTGVLWDSASPNWALNLGESADGESILRLVFGNNHATDGHFVRGTDTRVDLRFGSSQTYQFHNTILTTSTARAFQIYANAGAAANPTYAFSADANTGMYSDTADTIQFAANGKLQATLTQGTWTWQDTTATTGDSLFLVKGGAGESGDLGEWQTNGGTTLFAVHSTYGAQLHDSGSKPTCDASARGTIWLEEGGAGVKDTVDVCAKDAGDAYAWRTIY